MMKVNPRVAGSCAILFAGWFALSVVVAQQGDGNAAPAEEVAAEEESNLIVDSTAPKPVGALFDQLGGESARERIDAERSLIQQLADDEKRDRIRDRALELYSTSEDPEVWLRVREVLKSYVSEYSDFGPRRGFLGVRHSLTEYPDENGAIRRAVRVEMVVPDAPAAKAKVRSGDLVLKIDELDLDTPHGDLSFFRYIFLQAGGKKVKLKILRDWEVIELDVELAIRPVEIFGQQLREKKSPDELLRGWLKERDIELR